MAKNNKNKGFSLIEIVIAIAILSILLAPIIKQFASTMRMNRISKEQQAANENAQYVLEYYKNTDLDELKIKDSSKDIYPITDVTEIQRRKYEIDTDGKYKKQADGTLYYQGKGCEVYLLNASGDEISASPIGIVDYTVYEYKLNHVEVGSRRSVYERTVIMDNLAAALKDGLVWNPDPAVITEKDVDVIDLGYGLNVAYNLDAGITGGDDFSITNEGSYVKYDSTGKYVTAIVCTTQLNAIADPNTVNMGNIEKLNTSGAALITGSTSDFDNQAVADLYAKAMESLRESDSPTAQQAWQIEMENMDADSSYVMDAGFIADLRKLTVISVDKGTDDKGDYYIVNADVYYEMVYAGIHNQLCYNAFSQKFYYSESQGIPEIYFEYQPMVVDESIGFKVDYAAEEFILFDSKVDGAKVYLYKPRWDYAHRYLSGNTAPDPNISIQDETYLKTYATAAEKQKLESGEGTDDYNIAKAVIEARQNTYYANNYSNDVGYTSHTSKVKIHLNYAQNSKAVNVYTNMDVTDIDALNSQFSSTVPSIYDSYFFENNSKRFVSAFDKEQFKHIDDEDTSRERYFTVSVHMKPVDTNANEIILNGAKGD